MGDARLVIAPIIIKTPVGFANLQSMKVVSIPQILVFLNMSVLLATEACYMTGIISRLALSLHGLASGVKPYLGVSGSSSRRVGMRRRSMVS